LAEPTASASTASASVQSPDARDAHAPALDGVRAIAVLLVMLHHAGLPYTPFPIDLGLLGVRLFFVLSGFLITGILLEGRDARARGEITLGPLARSFYARRALRLVPVYYGTLLVLVVLDAARVRDDLPWHALYATSFLVARENGWIGIASHFWSLSVEELFYLLFPWLVLATPRRALPWICATFLLSGPLFRGLGVMHGLGRWPLLYTLPGCTDPLAVGALLAILHREAPSTLPRTRAALVAVAAIGLAIATEITASPGATALSHAASASKGLLHALLMGALVSACAAPRAAFVEGAPEPASWLARALAWAPLGYLGRISYTLYLVHPMVPYALRRLGVDTDSGLSLLAGAFVIPIAIAALSWHLVEAPILTLKRRFPYTRPPTAAPPAT
jgi:peptidoglycan/LPS O-acetylase OafA/YrhL